MLTLNLRYQCEIKFAVIWLSLQKRRSHVSTAPEQCGDHATPLRALCLSSGSATENPTDLHFEQDYCSSFGSKARCQLAAVAEALHQSNLDVHVSSTARKQCGQLLTPPDASFQAG
jgi:hypothetical protein